jgi:polyhydroxybutyrate depolymerase
MPLLFLAAFVGEPEMLTLQVDTTPRTAWVISPERPTAKPPLVFFFHGHGGSGRGIARSAAIHRQWPEAVVVYPNGLPSRTPNDPAGRRPGWDVLGETNRDLKFFDQLLDRLRRDKSIDPERVFVGGHSNGAVFTYYLWMRRPNQIAAFAPCAGAGGTRVTTPKPAFIVMGSTDAVVDPERQKASIDAVLKLNQARLPGKTSGFLSRFEGEQPTETYVFPGGHAFNRAAVSPMVKFFQSIGGTHL